MVSCAAWDARYAKLQLLHLPALRTVGLPGRPSR